MGVCVCVRVCTHIIILFKVGLFEFHALSCRTVGQDLNDGFFISSFKINKNKYNSQTYNMVTYKLNYLSDIK